MSRGTKVVSVTPGSKTQLQSLEIKVKRGPYVMLPRDRGEIESWSVIDNSLATWGVAWGQLLWVIGRSDTVSLSLSPFLSPSLLPLASNKNERGRRRGNR